MDISVSSRYKDFAWAIEVNRLSLEIIGLWPKTDGIVQRRLGSDLRVGFSFIMLAFVIGIPLVHALIRVWGDMPLMIDNFGITLPMLTVVLELVIFRWKQTVLSSSIKMIAEDWLTLKLSADRDVMIKRAWTVRLLTIYGFIIFMLGFIFFFVTPLFILPLRHLTNLTDRDKPLPLQTYYVYDTDKSLLFELTYFTQALALFLTIVIHNAINAFFICMIFHICGQLENFKNRMIRLISCKDFNAVLSNIIMTHLRLIRYANNTESAFTLILFVLVLQFGLIFCLCGFLLLSVITDENVNSSNISQISYLAIALICLLTQTFLYCFGGDLIRERCEAVYHTICDLQWYKLKPNQAKDIILLILLTKDPFRITVGKVLPLTMTTFCSLVKTMAGYISILLAKRN